MAWSFNSSISFWRCRKDPALILETSTDLKSFKSSKSIAAPWARRGQLFARPYNFLKAIKINMTIALQENGLKVIPGYLSGMAK
jgi:hypothetical protein